MFINGPKFKKKMVICTPFGEFVNGDQEGVMTPERLQAIARRAKKYPRQIKAYLNGDHPESRSDRPADGWFDTATIEYTTSYPGFPEGALVAECEAHGELAEWLMNDLVRGASIGTVLGLNPDGSKQGEVLDHVLISDDNFDKRVNIAAAGNGGEVVAYFTTVFRKEADVAEKELQEEVARLKEENAALKAMSPDEKVAAQLRETEALLAEKVREVAELTASNENLKGDVEKFRSPKAIEELQLQLKQEKRANRAAKIRRLVGDGVAEGQFNMAMVGAPKSGYNHPSDEMVLAWFKASIFKDNIERLEIMLETMPKQAIGRRYGSGEAVETAEVALTEHDKQYAESVGAVAEDVQSALKAKSLAEYAALKMKRG